MQLFNHIQYSECVENWNELFQEMRAVNATPLSNFPRSAPESIKFLKYSGAKFLVNKLFVIFMGLIFVEGPISDYIVYHVCPRFCMLNFMLQAKPAKPTKLSTN